MTDLSKPVQTRDGRKARVICTDRCNGNDNYPVLALVGDMEEVLTYTLTGHYLDDGGPESRNDLVNLPPEKRVGWINVYAPGSIASDIVHPSRELADALAAPSRLACVRVEYEVPAA